MLAIHADQIERYGGSHGVRDLGLLQSALYRPQAGYYPDLMEQAAALWESLSQNHPFVDGKKRVAFAVAYTFLAINGVRLTADSEQTQVFLPASTKRGNSLSTGWCPGCAPTPRRRPESQERGPGAIAAQKQKLPEPLGSGSFPSFAALH